MAKSITIGSHGVAGTAPTNATIKWNQAVVKDEVLLELFDGLVIGELEILSNTPQIDTELHPIKIDGFNNSYIKLVIHNTKINSAIAAKRFIITIRHIDTALVYATITFNYETAYTKLGLVTTNFRQWASNNNYGNGTTQYKPGQVLQFGRYPYTYNTFEGIEVSKDTGINGLNPRSNITPLKASVLTVTQGARSTTATEGANTIVKFKDTWKTLTAGLTPILRDPIIKDKSNAKAGASSIFFAVVQNMDLNTTGTNSTNNLLWGTTHTIKLDKSYYGFLMESTIHPTCAKGVNKISVKWDNQQSDIVVLHPYEYKGNFYCKVQPLKNVTRAALVGLQLHNAAAWDNGLYLSKVVRFDLKAGTNVTPMDLLEKEITVKVGETESYTLFTPSDTYRYTIDKPALCSVNQNESKIVGIAPGVAYVTFISKYGNLADGSIRLKVTVVDVPAKPTLTVNRKVVIVAVGDSAGVTVTATRADELRFKQNPDKHVRVYDYTTEDYLKSKISGRLNFRGLVEGTTFLTIESYYNGAKQLTEVIEIQVIKRGTYKIIADPIKVELDVKKNRYPDKTPVMLWATTNAKYIKYDYPTNESYFVEGTPVFTDMKLKFWPKTQPGKHTFTIYGHMLDPNKRVVSLDILVVVTKNTEVPKDQIWVALEHKQTGHADNADLDYRYFTVLKWLERKTISQVTSHVIKLPTRSGTLLTKEELDSAIQFPKRYYEYFNPGEPTRTTNPEKVNSLWLNTLDSKLWRCTDNTNNDNVWECEDGRQIGSVEKLRYPLPGERGFGVGPMSVDLLDDYGLIAMEGCYDPMHPNYGNYRDKDDNILVCIPRHYVKYDSEVNVLKNGETAPTQPQTQLSINKTSPLTVRMGTPVDVTVTTNADDYNPLFNTYNSITIEKRANNILRITPVSLGMESITLTAQKTGALPAYVILDVNVTA
jgi:hypothetical protein